MCTLIAALGHINKYELVLVKLWLPVKAKQGKFCTTVLLPYQDFAVGTFQGTSMVCQNTRLQQCVWRRAVWIRLQVCEMGHDLELPIPIMFAKKTNYVSILKRNQIQILHTSLRNFSDLSLCPWFLFFSFLKSGLTSQGRQKYQKPTLQYRCLHIIWIN